jgi:hypothetical protein
MMLLQSYQPGRTELGPLDTVILGCCGLEGAGERVLAAEIGATEAVTIALGPKVKFTGLTQTLGQL